MSPPGGGGGLGGSELLGAKRKSMTYRQFLEMEKEQKSRGSLSSSGHSGGDSQSFSMNENEGGLNSRAGGPNAGESDIGIQRGGSEAGTGAVGAGVGAGAGDLKIPEVMFRGFMSPTSKTSRILQNSYVSPPSSSSPRSSMFRHSGLDFEDELPMTSGGGASASRSNSASATPTPTVSGAASGSDSRASNTPIPMANPQSRPSSPRITLSENSRSRSRPPSPVLEARRKKEEWQKKLREEQEKENQARERARARSRSRSRPRPTPSVREGSGNEADRESSVLGDGDDVVGAVSTESNEGSDEEPIIRLRSLSTGGAHSQSPSQSSSRHSNQPSPLPRPRPGSVMDGSGFTISPAASRSSAPSPAPVRGSSQSSGTSSPVTQKWHLPSSFQGPTNSPTVVAPIESPTGPRSSPHPRHSANSSGSSTPSIPLSSPVTHVKQSPIPRQTFSGHLPSGAPPPPTGPLPPAPVLSSSRISPANHSPIVGPTPIGPRKRTLQEAKQERLQSDAKREVDKVLQNVPDDPELLRAMVADLLLQAKQRDPNAPSTPSQSTGPPLKGPVLAQPPPEEWRTAYAQGVSGSNPPASKRHRRRSSQSSLSTSPRSGTPTLETVLEADVDSMITDLRDPAGGGQKLIDRLSNIRAQTDTDKTAYDPPELSHDIDDEEWQGLASVSERDSGSNHQRPLSATSDSSTSNEAFWKASEALNVFARELSSLGSDHSKPTRKSSVDTSASEAEHGEHSPGAPFCSDPGCRAAHRESIGSGHSSMAGPVQDHSHSSENDTLPPTPPSPLDPALPILPNSLSLAMLKSGHGARLRRTLSVSSIKSSPGYAPSIASSTSSYPQLRRSSSFFSSGTATTSTSVMSPWSRPVSKVGDGVEGELIPSHEIVGPRSSISDTPHANIQPATWLSPAPAARRKSPSVIEELDSPYDPDGIRKLDMFNPNRASFPQSPSFLNDGDGNADDQSNFDASNRRSLQISGTRETESGRSAPEQENSQNLESFPPAPSRPSLDSFTRSSSASHMYSSRARLSSCSSITSLSTLDSASLFFQPPPPRTGTHVTGPIPAHFDPSFIANQQGLQTPKQEMSPQSTRDSLVTLEGRESPPTSLNEARTPTPNISTTIAVSEKDGLPETPTTPTDQQSPFSASVPSRRESSEDSTQLSLASDSEPTAVESSSLELEIVPQESKLSPSNQGQPIPNVPTPPPSKLRSESPTLLGSLPNHAPPIRTSAIPSGAEVPDTAIWDGVSAVASGLGKLTRYGLTTAGGWAFSSFSSPRTPLSAGAGLTTTTSMESGGANDDHPVVDDVSPDIEHIARSLSDENGSNSSSSGSSSGASSDSDEEDGPSSYIETDQRPSSAQSFTIDEVRGETPTGIRTPKASRFPSPVSSRRKSHESRRSTGSSASTASFETVHSKVSSAPDETPTINEPPPLQTPSSPPTYTKTQPVVPKLRAVTSNPDMIPSRPLEIEGSSRSPPPSIRGPRRRQLSVSSSSIRSSSQSSAQSVTVPASRMLPPRRKGSMHTLGAISTPSMQSISSADRSEIAPSRSSYSSSSSNRSSFIQRSGSDKSPGSLNRSNSVDFTQLRPRTTSSSGGSGGSPSPLPLPKEKKGKLLSNIFRKKDKRSEAGEVVGASYVDYGRGKSSTPSISGSSSRSLSGTKNATRKRIPSSSLEHDDSVIPESTEEEDEPNKKTYRVRFANTNRGLGLRSVAEAEAERAGGAEHALRWVGVGRGRYGDLVLEPGEDIDEFYADQVDQVRAKWRNFGSTVHNSGWAKVRID